MTESKDGELVFNQDPSYFEDQELRKLSIFALRIQLAATGIASSFLLLFVPNVETITILSFLFGFLFPTGYALSIVITMVVGWELLLTMVLSFSGITFFFKLLAWCLVTLLGTLARKMKVTRSYEFIIFGVVATLIFDIIVTISIPLVFVNNEEGFIAVLITALIFGIPFTISHLISNSVLFSLFPKLVDTILPLLQSRFPDILKIKGDIFSNSRRIAPALVFIFLLLIAGVGYASYSYYTDEFNSSDNIEILTVKISYNNILPTETHIVDVNTSMSFLEVTMMVANVSVSYEFGPPLVIGINGVVENENLPNHYWIYYIDGNAALFHAGTKLSRGQLENNSTLFWNYEAA